MKKNTITLLLVWLLMLNLHLMAQKPEGRFNLKEGDWFEVQFEQLYYRSFTLNGQPQKQLNSDKSFLLNYQLQKQLLNGNQQYIIRLDHYRVIEKNGERYFGYDSYYPPFETNKANPENKSQFNLEVTATGEIVRFAPDKNNISSQIILTEIGSSFGSFGATTYSDSNADSLLISIFSNYLMFPDSLPYKVPFDSKSKIPLMIKLADTQLYLTDASSPISNNAIIKGKVKELKNREIRISMLGVTPDYYFPEVKFKTNNDGSFNCPLFLKRPLHLIFQIDDKHLTTFMVPGDTLEISAFGHQAEWIPKVNFYRNTRPNGYFTPNIKKLDYFTGTAAYNTMLSNEIDQYRIHLPYPDSILTVDSYCKRTTNVVNNLIESYRDKASKVCIEYFLSDWEYFIWNVKMEIFNQQPIQQAYLHDPTIPKNRREINFFEIDSIPLLMNAFEWNWAYHEFISRTQGLKRIQFGPPSDHKIPYYFNLGTLSGYPLYRQLFTFLIQDFGIEFSNRNIVESFYHDFVMNCSDPSLIESLKKAHDSFLMLKIGNPFPVTSFALKDSSIFKLEKLKGKPICLVFFEGRKSSLNQFKENIEKFSTEEVEFVFVRSTEYDWDKSELDSTILKMPNVTYIEHAGAYLKSELLLGRTKIFMLDKWFRIVENNAEDPMTHTYTGSISEFEKSLRKTIETKRYSKSEKTAMVKTAGWSFGSILFTFLIGLWIYRIRISRIKKQEAAKRRIKELEIKAIRSQMNPHFIFNALNSIQSLINDNQFKEANIYLSKFAVLLRGVLNNSEKSRISLSDELQAVELYCQLEQLRFEFKFEISIDPDVNIDLIEIPGMIIQPLAENAVVHGLSAKGDQGKLDIQVKWQNGNLCVCVDDNGVGISTEKVDELSQKGFGLKLIEERINILNLDGKEARLTVENLSNTAGTVATLIIPID